MKQNKQNLMLYPPEIASNFIAEQEGFEAMAYKCPAGKWTIGFGHSGDVREGDLITRGEAYDLLDQDLIKFQEELATLVHVPVTANQFIALMSFLYNFGLTKCRTYRLFGMINRGETENIRAWWLKYCSPGSEFEEGLKRRRLKELNLFLS